MSDLWHISKIVKKGKYLYGVCKGHPKAVRCGYVLHHRLVMENYLGRLLEDHEVVHHVNEDRYDNRIENLQVMSNSDHVRLHASTGRATQLLVCPNCGTEFTIFTNQIKKGTKPRCSRKCNGQYSRKIQLGGIKP